MINKELLILVIFWGFVNSSSSNLLITILEHQTAIATLPAVGNVVLGKPFFIESYSNSTMQPQPPGTTFNTTGLGAGILNGSAEVQTKANATITFRDSQTMFLEGRAKYTDNNNDTASYMFLELGTINPNDLTYSGGGIAIFDQNATGMLNSLSNVVAVYKSSIDADGNATVYYYHWN